METHKSRSWVDVKIEPDFSIEEKWIKSGKKLIAGVDEVGRGPLAGPVVAAAVILNPVSIPDGLNDSKKLNETQRALLFEAILVSSHVAWCSLSASVIDRFNIRLAALRAMELSVQRLAVPSDLALIDGRDVPAKLADIGSAYIKGDSRSLSIAAASIVAKVIRDRMMRRAHEIHPQYGFDRHKGYASKVHRDALAKHGPCPLHRRSFAPIKHMNQEMD